MFNFERIYHTAIFIFVQSMCLRVLKKIINMRYLFTYLQTMFDFINGMLTSEVYEEKIIGHVLEDHEHSYIGLYTLYFWSFLSLYSVQ